MTYEVLKIQKQQHVKVENKKNKIEICGDGLHMGVLQCDDGNLLDGDGCSSTCTVEPNYICYGGNAYTPDKCKITLHPNFKQINYFGNKTVVLSFSAAVLFKDKIENILELQIEGKLNQKIIFSWKSSNNLYQNSQQTICIYMDYENSLTGDEILRISVNKPLKIVDIFGNTFQGPGVSTKLRAYSYISECND